MEKKNKNPQKRQQYYVVNLPKEDLKFFEDLRISKSTFINQACLSFLEIIRKEGKMNLYFRSNNGVQEVDRKDNLGQDDDNRRF